MQSLDLEDLDDSDWVNRECRAIEQYSAKIDSCIQISAWQMLAFVMRSRELYLYRLYTSERSERCRPQLRQLAEKILQQDVQVTEILEAKKNVIQKGQIELGRNRRAVLKYDQTNNF